MGGSTLHGLPSASILAIFSLDISGGLRLESYYIAPLLTCKVKRAGFETPVQRMDDPSHQFSKDERGTNREQQGRRKIWKRWTMQKNIRQPEGSFLPSSIQVCALKRIAAQYLQYQPSYSSALSARPRSGGGWWKGGLYVPQVRLYCMKQGTPRQRAHIHRSVDIRQATLQKSGQLSLYPGKKDALHAVFEGRIL